MYASRYQLVFNCSSHTDAITLGNLGHAVKLPLAGSMRAYRTCIVLWLGYDSELAACGTMESDCGMHAI